MSDTPAPLRTSLTYNQAVGKRAGVNSAKVQTNTTIDGAFDAEARRMGAIFSRRQWLGALGMVVGILVWLAAVVWCVVLMPRAHPQLILVVLFGGCFLGFVPLSRWMKHSKASLRRLLAVKCPQCGGAARFETVALPDTHIYMVCPECRTPFGYGVQRSAQSQDRGEVFDVLQLGDAEDDWAANNCARAAAWGA